MKYRYFVSFDWSKGGSHGTGDCEVSLENPVTNYDHIVEMKEKVREAINDVDFVQDADITIINYVQFKDE